MSDIDDIPEFIVRLSLDFNGIRAVGSKLTPTKWKLVAEVLYDEFPEDEEEDDFGVKVAIAKIRYWFDNVFSGSMIFDGGNEFAHRSFFDDDGRRAVDNNVVILPAPPTDDLLMEVLHSKLNALGAPYIQFGTMELTSDDDNQLSYIFTGLGETNLPSITDWVGERAFFDKPWWARDDGSTYDSIPDEDADLSQKPTSAFSLDFVRKSLESKNDQEAVIIRPATFNPTIIAGGLDSDGNSD